MKISGDLGGAGYAQEVLRLILPIYNPNAEDPYIGLNILQSFLETDRIEEGKEFLNKMYDLKRPDIIKRLDSFRAEFDKRRNEVRIGKGVKYAIIPIEEIPEKLLSALSKYFSSRPNVESAYCARLYLIEEDKSSNFIGIKMKGKLSEILDDLGKVTRKGTGVTCINCINLKFEPLEVKKIRNKLHVSQP